MTTETYYAARMTNAFIDAVRLGVRDLRNSDLAPFYSGPSVPPAAVDQRTAAARVASPTLTRSAYQRQAGEPSQGVFVEYVSRAGIELTFDNDFYETETVSGIPAGGSVTGILSGETFDVPIRPPRVRDLVAGSSLLPAATQHIRIASPLVVADSDPFVRIRVDRMQQFINRLLTAK